jgi:hypothetical protein
MHAESGATHPSPVIAYLVRQLGLVLPDPDERRLAGHADEVARSTSHGDLHRAWRCAGWAVDVAEHSGHSHLSDLARDLKEVHRLWRDSWFGAEFGVMVKDGVGPGHDIEIQWVDDAVRIATSVAQETGWASVPWEDLLSGLLAIKPQ